MLMQCQRQSILTAHSINYFLPFLFYPLSFIPPLASLQIRFLDPPPRLVKPNLPPRPQRLLQRTPNPNGLNRSRQLHRQLLVLQRTLCELIRLIDKRLPKSAVIILWNLPPNAASVVNIHEILNRRTVNGQFALRADDLGAVFLTRSHHPRTIEVGDLATVELDDADAVVDVAVFGEIGLHGGDAAGDDGFDGGVLAEEPEG
jgi:hypothetical protein